MRRAVRSMNQVDQDIGRRHSASLTQQYDRRRTYWRDRLVVGFRIAPYLSEAKVDGVRDGGEEVKNRILGVSVKFKVSQTWGALAVQEL